MSVRGDAGPGLARYVPAVGWLGGYQGSWLQVGLYVATVPMLVYALLGTSRSLSVSTTSTLAALTAAAVASAAAGDPDRGLVAASTPGSRPAPGC
jgi:MFS superfamily sulfate permease-like transporter